MKTASVSPPFHYWSQCQSILTYPSIILSQAKNLKKDEPDLSLCKDQVRFINTTILPQHVYFRTGVPFQIIQSRGMLGISTGELDCDYYDYMNKKEELSNLYRGEYMSQYSFAEFTNANLFKKLNS